MKKTLFNLAVSIQVFAFTALGQGMLASSAQALTNEQVEQITLDEYAASPMPDRIILNLTADPAHSQAVTWRTDTSVLSSQAQIALAKGSPDFTQAAISVNAVTELLSHDGIQSNHHSVTFENLEADTQYAYRVGDGQLWSEWFQFTTASDKTDPFAFVYFGDAQNNVKSMWSRTIRQAYKSMPDVDFMLHAGDLVNREDSDKEWAEWFYAGGWLNGMVPSIMTPGNHEYDNELSPQWRPHFTLPENGPDKIDLAETVYYVDYQGVRIISLNTQAMSLEFLPRLTTAQKKWVETLLANNPNRWTVITHHHPMFAAAEGRSGHARLNLHFRKLYEEYGVDLVLQGHDHSYGRGENLSLGGRIKGIESGPMYVVSVSGPKQYESDGGTWADVAIGNTQLYQLIRVEDDVLKFEAYDSIGVLRDAFHLVKQEDGTNEVKEIMP